MRQNYVFKEITDDHGAPYRRYAKDNYATYIITSARGHDLCAEYAEKFPYRQPSARWYNRHFQFTRVK